MKKLLYFNSLLFIFLLGSCSDDDKENMIDLSVAFNQATISLSDLDTTKEITLSLSRAATEAGTISLDYTLDNAVYGTDFTTVPSGESGSIIVPVAKGDLSAAITFTKLQNPVEGTTKSVTFSLANMEPTSWKNGKNSSVAVSFTPIASMGGVMDIESGGSNEPNQVYIDLSTGQQKAVRRDSWELAFYNGAENRVFLNASLLVSAAKIKGQTDLNAVSETTVLAEPLELNSIDLATFEPKKITVTTVAELIAGLPLGYAQYGNEDIGLIFTDSKTGNLEGTAFAEIATTASENFVYIVGLGNSIPTEPAENGSIKTTGDHMGFMKVRILTDGTTYTVQYAPLEATTFSEFTITKNDSRITTSFSLTNNAIADVEPIKEEWDINFTSVFSYYEGGYGFVYSDYVLHNTLGNVGLYKVTVSDGMPIYANFKRADVDEVALSYNDKTIIGSDWRSVDINTGTTIVKDDRYYILKDADGNFYKLKFTAAINGEGVRGNPQFVYERL